MFKLEGTTLYIQDLRKYWVRVMVPDHLEIREENTKEFQALVVRAYIEHIKTPVMRIDVVPALMTDFCIEAGWLKAGSSHSSQFKSERLNALKFGGAELNLNKCCGECELSFGGPFGLLQEALQESQSNRRFLMRRMRCPKKPSLACRHCFDKLRDSLSTEEQYQQWVEFREPKPIKSSPIRVTGFTVSQHKIRPGGVRKR